MKVRLFVIFIYIISVNLYSMDFKSVAEIVKLTDPVAKTQRSQAILSELSYKGLLEAKKPDLSLVLNPVTFDSRRIVDFTNFSPERGPGYNDVKTLSFGADLKLSQSLITGGSLNFALENDLEILNPGNSAEFSYKPKLNFNFVQPIFTGEEILPVNGTRAKLTSGEILLEQSRNRETIAINKAIRNSFELITQIIEARNSLEINKLRIESAEKNVESISLRFTGGTVTQELLEETELFLEVLKQNNVDLLLTLQDLEQKLGDLLGLSRDEVSNIYFDPESAFVLVDKNKIEEIKKNPDIGNNLDLINANWELEKTKKDIESRKIFNGGTLTGFAVVNPRYPDSRVDKTINSAFSDYLDTDNNSGLDWTVGLNVEFKLNNKGSLDIGKSQDKELIELGTTNIENTQRITKNLLLSLLDRRESLLSRIEIQGNIINLERKKLERIENLAETGTVSIDSVNNSKIEFRAKENELLKFRFSLFILDLDILILNGAQIIP
jgi:outer membrane protein TolC